MSNSRIILAALIMVCISFMSLSGNCDDLRKSDDNVLAAINKYKLTVADFKSEAKGKLPANLSEADLEKAKEDMLDELITKKLLIQEAQKQNFDKDKAFIKEIEMYWEQALLKLLYRKKSQELLGEADVSEKDPVARDIKARQAFSAWMEGLEKKADIKKYKDNLKEIRW